MASDEAVARPSGAPPAWAGRRARCVEAQAGEDDVRVPVARVHGHPPAGTRVAPSDQRARVERLGEESARMQDAADRARAVVAPVLEASMAAAVLQRSGLAPKCGSPA